MVQKNGHPEKIFSGPKKYKPPGRADHTITTHTRPPPGRALKQESQMKIFQLPQTDAPLRLDGDLEHVIITNPANGRRWVASGYSYELRDFLRAECCRFDPLIRFELGRGTEWSVRDLAGRATIMGANDYTIYTGEQNEN